jgi:hypothetical protein
MKTNYTIIIALLIGFMSSYSQPVLNPADFTSFYNSDGYSASDVVGLSPGNAGPNQTWNFSGLATLTLDGTFSVVPFGTAPYISNFPTANFALKSTAVGFSDSYYSFYKSSPTTFESVGGADNTYIDLEVDHSTIFQFPYIYGTVINDTYQYVDDPTSHAFTSTYDGYGTLATPYGTYTNVIRQKKVEVDYDYTYTEYAWFTTNPFKYIMSVSFNVTSTSSNNGVVVFTNFANLGVNSNNKEKSVTVYPNPTTSTLNLHFSNAETIDKVVIIDVSGKIVKQQTENTTQINVEKLATGLYIIEAYSGKEKFQTKFIKE